MVGDLARGMPRINVALENRQAEYQTSMVEVEGMLNHKPIFILIELGNSMTYVSPSLVEKSKLLVEIFQSHGWFN